MFRNPQTIKSSYLKYSHTNLSQVKFHISFSKLKLLDSFSLALFLFPIKLSFILNSYAFLLKNYSFIFCSRNTINFLYFFSNVFGSFCLHELKDWHDEIIVFIFQWKPETRNLIFVFVLLNLVYLNKNILIFFCNLFSKIVYFFLSFYQILHFSVYKTRILLTNEKESFLRLYRESIFINSLNCKE